MGLEPNPHTLGVTLSILVMYHEGGDMVSMIKALKIIIDDSAHSSSYLLWYSLCL